jgi:hypothetical protein
MANTFELISSTTVGAGGASSIDFTSIPSTYTDLCIKVSVRDSRPSLALSDFKININGGGASANITTRALSADGSSASSFTDTFIGFIEGNGGTANTFSNMDIYIPNYAGSTNKSMSTDYVTENNATAAWAGLAANLWSQTAAITSLSFTSFAGPFLQYSSIYLYGVKNA